MKGQKNNAPGACTQQGPRV